MHVLLVKLSSMGDLVQSLPAITDATRAVPGIRFDWVVDEAFADVPAWHPAVDQVIRSAHRRWRKSPIASWRSGELKAFWHRLREREYDCVLDAQTNLKSAAVTRMALGLRVGPDRHSVCEYGAHWAYQKRVEVGQNLHAVERWRLLFAQGLGYERPTTPPDFGLEGVSWPQPKNVSRPFVVAVTNASWPTKCLPDRAWRGIIERAGAEGLDVLLPWGAEPERERAEVIARGLDNAKVLPKLSLTQLAGLLSVSEGAICNDTGLAHIAAAVNAPCVTAYGPTDPGLIGATGDYATHLGASGFACAPCYQRECRYQDYRGPQAQCLLALGADALWRLFNRQRELARQ